MKPLFVLLLTLFFNFVAFSQSDTNDFLIRNRGTREVIEISGSKAVAFKLISFETQYGKQWRLERISEVDTLYYNNQGVYEGTNGELRIKNEGYTFKYIPDGERSKLKVNMKRDGYLNPNAKVNSSYWSCKIDSLEEVLRGVSGYFQGFSHYYRSYYGNNVWEEGGRLADIYQNFETFKTEFDPNFEHFADSLVKIHSGKAALTDSTLKNLNTIEFREMDSVFLRLTNPEWDVSFGYCDELVNDFVVENPARFCQWLEQTGIDKRTVYRYVNKGGRKSLKAFETDSPVKKEILQNHRANIVAGIFFSTLTVSVYGGIGVGIANLLALNR